MNSTWLLILFYFFTAVIFKRGGTNCMTLCKAQGVSADSLYFLEQCLRWLWEAVSSSMLTFDTTNSVWLLLSYMTGGIIGWLFWVQIYTDFWKCALSVNRSSYLTKGKVFHVYSEKTWSKKIHFLKTPLIKMYLGSSIIPGFWAICQAVWCSVCVATVGQSSP